MLSCTAGGSPTGHKGMDGCGPEQKPVFGCGEVASRGTVHLLLLQPQLLGFCSGAEVRFPILQTENKCIYIYIYPCIFVLNTS